MHVLAFWGAFAALWIPFFRCVALQNACCRLLAPEEKFGPDAALEDASEPDANTNP